jgi:hypothetical protein
MFVLCDACKHVRHRECRGHPPCNCAQCWGATVLAEGLRAYESSNTVQVLRAALGAALAVAWQKQRHREVMWRQEPVRAGACLCGCGQQVIASKFGRPRLYVSRGHRKRAYRRRVRMATVRQPPPGPPG